MQPIDILVETTLNRKIQWEVDTRAFFTSGVNSYTCRVPGYSISFYTTEASSALDVIMLDMRSGKWNAIYRTFDADALLPLRAAVHTVAPQTRVEIRDNISTNSLVTKLSEL